MKREKKVWAMTLIAFWYLSPNQTNAQQDSLQVKHLDEVVVTATKFPKSLSETGKVLTVIDEDQLSRSGGKDLSQVLNEQAGIVVNGATTNPGKDKSIFLRGAGSQYTLILLDGIPLNDASGGGGSFDPRMIPVDQIERIEILKGSQSTLYGTDAMAGVINIITKQRGSKPVGGYATTTYGSYNTFKGNAGIQGSTKWIDYNAGYTRYTTDGISEAKDETGNQNFDKDGFHQNAVNASLTVKPTQNFNITPFFRYSDFKGQYDAGSFTDDPSAHYTSKLINYGLHGQMNFDKGAIHAVYARNITKRNFVNQFYTSPFKGKFNHAEAFVNYNLHSHVQLLSGLSIQSYKMDNDGGALKNPSSNIVSPYVSFFVRNLSGFSAEAGGRYVYHSVYGENFTYSLNPSYLLAKQVKLFANYSTAFKAPTLSELYGPFGANDKLKPQESKTFESGAQFFSKDQRFDIRATAFWRNIDQAIIYANGRYVNLDQTDDHGIEIEPSFRLNSKVNVRGYYAFVNGHVTTKDATGESQRSENTLLRRPKHSFGVYASFQVTPQLNVTANFKTFGKRNDVFFNTSDYSSSNVVLSAYQLLDLYASYSLWKNQVRLFVDAHNVLNQNYIEVYGYNTQKFNITGGISINL